MPENIEDLWDKIWRDKRGRIVIWQTPNVWLILWAVATILSILTNSKTSDLFFWIGTASLTLWSVLEIIRGANYFRRALGAVIMVMVVISVVHAL